MGRKKKPIYEGTANYAFCNKTNKITVTEKILTPAVKAEKERVLKIEKDEQKSLN